MTKAILIGLFMASLSTSKAQISMSIPFGVSSLKAPVIGANLQAKIGGFIIGGGFDSHISRDIMKGDLFYSKLGAAFNLSDLNSLEISAGMGQYRRSSDVKSLNEGIGLVNVQYVHQMASRPEGAIFVSVTGTQKFTIVTGGLRFIFRKKERDGCPSNLVR